MPPPCGSVAQAVEPVAGFSAIVRVGEDQDRVRPFADVPSGLLRPVNERETDPWFLRFVSARCGVELRDGFGMLSLSQGHVVSEARKRA